MDRDVQIPDRALIVGPDAGFQVVDSVAVALKDHIGSKIGGAVYGGINGSAVELIVLFIHIDVVHQPDGGDAAVVGSGLDVRQRVDIGHLRGAGAGQRGNGQQAQRQGDGQKPCQNSLSHLFIPPCSCWGVFFLV